MIDTTALSPESFAYSYGFMFEAVALRAIEYSHGQVIRTLDAIEKNWPVRMGGTLTEKQFFQAVRNQMGNICRRYENLPPHTPEFKYRKALVEEYLLSSELDIFSTEIVDLGLAVRTENRLGEAGILDLGALIENTEMQLHQSNKFSRFALNDIKKALERKHRHLQLGMSFFYPIIGGEGEAINYG